jgi:capsular polysaccharide biosynthesis protein
MISAEWDAPDFDDDQPPSSRAAPTLVSLHFIRFALRRRWLVCVLSSVLGLLAAGTLLVAFPALHDAKAALVLVHDPQDEPSRAMATDVSLLETRTLAEKAVASLGLTMTPDAFLKTMKVVPVSSELLSITLTGPSDAEAVRRLEMLTSLYLDFRGEQLSLQSKVYVQGIQLRITKLQSEVGALSQKIEQLSRAGSGSASKVNDAISQRAFVQGRIDTLQQEVEDVTLRTTSIVSASRVIDPAAVESHAAKRRIVLALASGLIGGAALGCGMVLFLAITSDRLRRRSDVAAALEIPVPVSVGRISPISKRWLWLSHLRTLDGRRSAERQRLAHAIEMELPFTGHEGRIAVACIDNADEVSFAVAAAAADLTEGGFSTTLIDLTEGGSLGGIAPSAPGSHNAATLLRPRGIPTLASGTADLRAVGQDEDENLHSFGLTDVTLMLADLDPSVGADHLIAWTERVIIVVTAGRSSAERVRTAADMVRTAGLELRFAALLHAERTDDSSGTAGFDQVVPIQLVEPPEEQVLEEQVAGDELISEQDWIAEELTVDEEQATVAQAAVLQEQLTEEPAASEEQELIAQEQTAYDHELAALQVAEDQPADEDQATIEQAAVLQEQLTEEPAASEEQELIAQEQTAYDHELSRIRTLKGQPFAMNSSTSRN